MSLWTGVAIGALSLAACGGSEEDRPCAGVTCDFGTCNPDNGQCVNEDTCRVDAQCVPGYECNGGSCQALDGNECSSDADCEAGVCDIGEDEDSGACVNADSCTENSDCLERTFCDVGPDEEEGTCEPDPCNNKTCQRGVCQRGTDNCVSADSCTEETEVVDCVAGEKCAVTGEDDSGTCEGTDSFCDDFECGDNGVCDFDAGGCTDADTCESDSDCLEGKFCNEMGQCQPNLCEQGDVTCEGNGTCQPATGQCQNATSCESTEDCINNPPHLCVDGTCTLESVACGDGSGDGGCPGNQLCEYDGDNLSASCAEPDTCETSLDCTGDRQCAGRTCQDPKQCEDDNFEPNNGADEATNFIEASSSNTLSASVCSDDTDIYTVDSTELASPDFDGTMLVELDVPKRERGLGSIDLTVTDPDGTEVGSVSTGSMGTEAQIEVAADVSVSNRGEYTVEVSAGDDVKTSGVRYELSANATSSETISACQDTTPIRVDQRISGTTEGAASSGMGSSCTSADNTNPEKVYALELDAPQEVTFELTPQLSSSNLSMSLRSRCTQPASEQACVDAGGDGDAEELTALLGEGTHYLVVQAPDEEGASGGPFELTVDRVFTACSSQDDYCDDDGAANICTTDGGRFRQVDCDAGCNPSTGRCIPPEGNTCGDAPVIDPDNASNRQISLNQLTDEFSLEDGTCLADDDEQAPTDLNTGGPDQAFQVDIPPRTAFTADVTFQNEVEGAVYLVGDCSDTDGTCQAGAQGSVDDEFRETFSYSNLSEEVEDGDNSETLYLVVDTKEGEPVTSAELSVNFEDVICEPETNRCNTQGGTTQTEMCGAFGTEWQPQVECQLGCDAGTCVGNTCDAPVQVPDNSDEHTYTFNPDGDDFSNDYDIDGADCRESSLDDSPGPEAVFEVQAEAGELITASWDHDDPSLYISSDCSDLTGSCNAHVEDYQDGEVTTYYVAPTTGSYYVVPDVDDTSTTSYRDGTLTVQVTQATCNPHVPGSGQCVDQTTIEQCTQKGEYGSAKACVGCNNGSCSGDTCGDATSIPVDGTEYTYDLNPSVYSDQYDIDGASCRGSSFDDSPGPEAVFSIDASEGDIIEASWDHDDPSFYLVDDCQSVSSGGCISHIESRDDEEVGFTHKVDSQGMYYLMADVDDTSGTDYRDGTLTARATKEQCDPSTYTPQCDGSGNLQWCNSLGLYETYSCDGSCSSGSCGTPRGGICADAVTVQDGDTVSSKFDGVNSLDPVGNGNTGNCSFDEDTAGADFIYQVDLAGGEKLTANYDGQSGSTGSDSSDDVMYLLKDCSDASTCEESVNSDGSLTYTAASGGETVYVVMDHESYTDEPSDGSGYGFNLDITVNSSP